MNSIVIVGRAVRDAEVRYSTGEKSTAFGNYTLAVDRPYKKDGEKETDFIMCKVVGKTAEFAEKYITKDNQRMFSLSNRNLQKAKMRISRITMCRLVRHLLVICLPIRRGS